MIHNFRTPAEGADGQSAAERFADRAEIRRYAEMLLRAARSCPKSL